MIAIRSDVILSVAIDGGRIDSIKVVSSSEPDGISDPVFTEIIPSILKEQHLAVDNIVGVTCSSKAIKEVVKDTTAKAGIEIEMKEKAKKIRCL